MVSDHLVRLSSPAFRHALALVTMLACAGAFAGQPLVLDTQQGISDGQNGMILQTAPLSRAPMVEAQRPAAAAGLAPESSPPLVVAPYVEVPGGGSRPAHSPRPRLRRPADQSSPPRGQAQPPLIPQQ